MKKFSRRQLLGYTAAGFAALPALSLTKRLAIAAEVPKVDPSDPQAKALAYVHQSPEPAQNCANCQLYQGSADSEWGPCVIFPGKEVAAKGWCSAWVKQA